MRPDVDPSEVATVLAALVEPQAPGEDDLAELAYLASRVSLLDAVVDEIRRQRNDVALRLNTAGATLRQIGDHVGFNHSAAQKWVDEAKERAGSPT